MKMIENLIDETNLVALSAEELSQIEGGNANYDTATGIMCGAAVSGAFFGPAIGFTGLAFGPGCALMLGMRFMIE